MGPPQRHPAGGDDDGTFPVGAGANPNEREIHTGWKKSPAPFKGKGYRQRAHLVYRPSGDGRYSLQVRVEKERNESFRPLDPTHAKWEADDDDEELARIVLQYIRSTLGGEELNVGAKRVDPFRR